MKRHRMKGGSLIKARPEVAWSLAYPLLTPEPAIRHTDRPEHTNMTTADTAHEDVTRLQHMAREFEEGFNTGDVDRIMRFYGETYVDVNLRNPVQTRAERRVYYAQVIKRGGFRVKVQPDDIQIHENFAFVRGTLELIREENTGQAARTELRYLEIVRRQSDGSWKVMWGMDGPIQEYAPVP